MAQSFEQSLRYEIIDELGTGAFAHVFKAFDRTLDRVVAVKVLHRKLNSEQAQRFEREVEICQRLRHKNIVQMFDANLEAEHPYMVMEYLDGDTLDLLLECGAFPIEHAIDIITQIAWALEHLHKFELLHRDIKPANIVLIEGERAVLTDFNLSLDVEATAISVTGQVAGTPRYMAPELWYGESATPSSDVFSLALVLYELLTGEEALKRGPDGLPMPVNSLPDQVLVQAPWLEPIMEKATNFDSGLRYEYARRFARALEGRGQIEESVSVSVIEKTVVEKPVKTSPLRLLWLFLPLVVASAFFFFTRAETPETIKEGVVEITRKLSKVEHPPIRECIRLGKMVTDKRVTSVILLTEPAARGLYALALQSLESKRITARDWQLLNLFLRRHGTSVLKRPSAEFWVAIQQSALRARELNECVKLFDKHIRGPMKADIAVAAIPLALDVVAAYETSSDRLTEPIEKLCTLIEPVVFAHTVVPELDQALNIYLTCIAYLRNEKARSRLMRVLDRFCSGNRIDGVDENRCAWRCSVLLAMSWEPIPSEKRRAIHIVERALKTCKDQNWRVELECMRALLTTRGLGGAFNPTKEQTKKALSITKPLLAEMEENGSKVNRAIAAATHVVMLDHDLRPKEAAKLFATLSVDDLPPSKKWWYYQAAAWRLSFPKTRQQAIKAHLKTVEVAPPELKWYFKLLSEGMDASRLLDHFFEK